MDALVLSGGEIKIFWQAGAIEALLDSGFRPQIITGISAGALCAGKLAMDQDDWATAGHKLTDFLLTNVKGPKDVARKRGILELAWRIWRKKWDGLIDTEPMAKLVRKTLTGFPREGIAVKVGYVPLRTGDLTYVGANEPGFVDAVLASTAEPIAMPLRAVGGLPSYDGGLRDISPMKQAIALGATNIVAITCQPERLSLASPNKGNVLHLLGRVLAVVTNEIVTNDMETLEKVNAQVLAGRSDKRLITLTSIRPRVEIPVNIDSFTAADGERMVEQGRREARQALELARAA